MIANEGYKAARFKSSRLEGVAAAFHVEQFLILGVAYRKNQPAAFRELSTERFRHGGGCRGNEDGVKGSEFGQAECAITTVNMDICITEALEASGCRSCQFGMRLNTENDFRQA